MDSIQLHGKVLVTGQIRAVTGLRIGGGSTGIEIGGVDNVVVRNPLTNEPYIPGSSLKGKMRSLLERHTNAEQNRPIRRGKPKVYIHECEDNERGKEQYKTCPVCRIFGVAGEKEFATPSRLYVRDVHLTEKSRRELEAARTELPLTEVKWEAAIDRVTSAAVPRQMERVPAGAVFAPFEFIFNFYEQSDTELFMTFLQTLELLQDDYVGGGGSRGSGKIALEGISVTLKSRKYYDGDEKEAQKLLEDRSFEELKRQADTLIQQIKQQLFAG
jgi:CRISPR-associated protein Csm3